MSEEISEHVDRFVFRGGVLAIDLVNTEINVRAKRCDLLQKPDDLAAWWAEVLRNYTLPKISGSVGEIAPELFAEVKEFRGALRNIFASLVQGKALTFADLEPLNRILAYDSMAMIPEENGQLEVIHRLREPAQHQMLVAVGLSALELLKRNEFDRLHQCQNERCIVFFYDTSKSATRHWCGPRCLNRARSIQNYKRKKTSLRIE